MLANRNPGHVLVGGRPDREDEKVGEEAGGTVQLRKKRRQ